MLQICELCEYSSLFDNIIKYFFSKQLDFLIKKLYYILLFPRQETAEEGKKMCSPSKVNTLTVSVHCIERFVERRLKIPDLSYYDFFKSPDHIVSASLKIKISAQENYFSRMFADKKYHEALKAFDRFYAENGILCLSTVALMVIGLFYSDETVEISGMAELYLKQETSGNPRLENDVRYYRFDDLIFVVREQNIITCFWLEPHQINVLDAILHGESIQLF